MNNLSEDLRQRLIVHTRRDREERLREWMESRGRVFVSVAFNEGQDWKYDVCDAQILLKVPFPDLGDKRVKRRLEMGRHQWYDNQAMLEVIQAYGRAVRAEDDRARFYVVDGASKDSSESAGSSYPTGSKMHYPSPFFPVLRLGKHELGNDLCADHRPEFDYVHPTNQLEAGIVIAWKSTKTQFDNVSSHERKLSRGEFQTAIQSRAINSACSNTVCVAFSCLSGG